MAGFAVLVTPDLSPQELESDFSELLQLTARYKQLGKPSTIAKGTGCMAVKFDSDASIHPGIVHDDQTGSWLLAAGTVVALMGDNDPTTVLKNLIHSYIYDGENALEQYDGHFGLVFYNGRDESISVVSDPIGLYSTFYGQRGTQIFISTSALAVAKQIQSQPDILAIEHFLRTGRLDANKTLWLDVKRLLAAKILRITKEGIEELEYWAPTYDISISRMRMVDALDLSVDLLSRTFSRALKREGKVWVDLTGGFDTRLIATFITKLDIPFITYCMGPSNSSDVTLAEKIVQEMLWEYVHTKLPEQWEQDQYSWFNTALGYGDGCVSVLRLASTIRGFTERNALIKKNVVGIGGENWRGYYWKIEKGEIGRNKRINYEALLDKLFSTPIPLQVMRIDRTRDVRLELLDFARQICSRYAEYPNTVQLDRFEIYRDAGHGGTYLSSVSGIERSLAPLCFKAPVDFAISLNYLWKLPMHHSFIRVMLERENKKLAGLDTTTGGPAIPIRLANFHQFLPLWKSVMNSAIATGSKNILGKTVHLWPQFQKPGYPLATWRLSFYSYARSEGLLSYDRMNSGGLYNPKVFTEFAEQAMIGRYQDMEFLDLVISIEMAMRATGTCIS